MAMFESILKLKVDSKTWVFLILLAAQIFKLSSDSILRFVLVMIQYLEYLFRNVGKALVKPVGKIIEKGVG